MVAYPLGKQTADCNSLHDWLMSLAMNLTALCDVEVKMAPVDAVWWDLVYPLTMLRLPNNIPLFNFYTVEGNNIFI